MGKMLYSGLSYTLEEGDAKRVKDVFVHGQLIKKTPPIQLAQSICIH